MLTHSLYQSFNIMTFINEAVELDGKIETERLSIVPLLFRRRESLPEVRARRKLGKGGCVLAKLK
jgi:hypothetical protein